MSRIYRIHFFPEELKGFSLKCLATKCTQKTSQHFSKYKNNADKQ